MRHTYCQKTLSSPVLAACFVAFVLVLAHVGSAFGNEPTLVIENARVIVGNGEINNDVSVVVHGDRIKRIGKQVPVPTDAQVIDARGMTLMPGLIDTHVHLLSWVASEGEKATRKYLDDEVPKTLEKYLANGVTTIKSIADPVDLIIPLRDRVQSGKLLGPRLLVVGPCFTATVGHPAVSICKSNPWCRQQLCVEVDDVEIAREAVRDLVARKVDAIKIVYDGETEGWRKLKYPVMKSIIDEAHRHRVRVTVHTPIESDAIAAIEAGADGVEHGVLLGRIKDDKLANLMKRRGAFYVPTFSVQLHLWGKEKLVTPKMNLRTLYNSGVKIAVGTDTFGEQEPGANTIQELELMVEAGMPTHAVIEAATRNAAEHLGIHDDVGTIEQGKIADLIIVDGDPLADISKLRSVQTVIQAGQVVHEATRD